MIVCFDDFDADEIWSQAAPTRPARGTGTGGSGKPAPNQTTPNPTMSLRGLAEGSLRARSDIDSLSGSMSGMSNSGRWQRGVALPPASETLDGSRRGAGARGGAGRGGEDAENPEDLWDDPIDINQSGGAADLSQFGALLDGETGSPLGGSGKRRSRAGSSGGAGSGLGGMFDLSDMSEAAKKFEMELHADRNRESSADDSRGLDSNLGHRVDPRRPLALAGTTIRSGSGDDVNVFEDFGAPTESKTILGVDNEDDNKEETEDSASSRLMKMIGVEGSGDVSGSKLMSSWGASGGSEEPDEDVPAPNIGGFGGTSLASAIPSNPWGTPMPAVASNEPFSMVSHSRSRSMNHNHSLFFMSSIVRHFTTNLL